MLYGTSYGTKVALEYAERYPQHVEALVLDSVVPADGPEPFAIPTFQAIAPESSRSSVRPAPARGSRRDPLADLAAADRAPARAPAERLRLRRRSAAATTTELSERGLLDVLEAGDLNPALRALLPAAIRSALGGRSRPAAAPAGPV